MDYKSDRVVQRPAFVMIQNFTLKHEYLVIEYII